MGSSKTGSLDKFASFSPAAALASGKVKLPETGLVGMLQQRQEDKVTRNAARMAGQPQQTPYDQMMMQMMGQQKRPEFMSPYSPAPYANGGNVALRRKMFKLGGSASAHGTGLTSGLEFNQGGRVGLKSGGSTVDDLFEKTSKGAKKFGKKGKAVGFGIDTLRRILGLGAPRGKKFTSNIADMIRGPRTAADAGFLMRALGKPTARTLRAGALGTGVLSVPGALSAAADRFLPGDFADTEQEAKGSGFERTLRALRIGAETGLDFSPLGFGYEALDYLTRDPSVTGGRDLSDFVAGRERAETPQEMGQEDSIKPGMSVSELKELANQRQREDLQAAMEMYQELIRGEDNTNKLMTLGDAAIAAGAALMEGEGYGGAATAFNEPLAQARMTQAERDQAAQSAAAQLAIGEDMSRRQADEALFNTLAAEGQLDTAEEIDAIVLARKFGIVSRLPEDDKGEVAEGITSQAGVYVDPKKRFGGKLFVSINSSGDDIATNDPEEAKQHAKS